MKAISLWQPWATLMAIGVKKIETRSWPTKHRGLLAVHAAKKWNQNLLYLCQTNPICEALDFGSLTPREIKGQLFFGAVVAVGYLEDCVEITQENTPIGDEYLFGDYTPGRFMWKFRDIKKITAPIPYRGAQGLFNVPPIRFKEGVVGNNI